MYGISYGSHFERDVKTCSKLHWDMEAFKQAIADLMQSDEIPLNPRYREHALVGSKAGYRAIHVDSAPNPPKDRWVLMYKIQGNEITLVRTGTHEEVYGK